MTDILRPDPAALAEAAADWIVQRLAGAPGRLATCLSGGSTPKLLYETLARAPWRDRMPWNRVHWFWGDERFVTADDAASNQGMVVRAMLDLVPAPEALIHPMPVVGFSPEAAAIEYERELRAFKAEAPDRALFDLVLMGLGTNGHTASIWPGESVVDERTAWVGAGVAARKRRPG